MQLHKVVVLIAGLPGSGKSVFSEIAKALSIPVVILGDIVREEVSNRGLEPTLEIILSVAQELREQYGKEAVVKLALDRLKKALEKSCIVIVDGIRSLDEVNYIRSYIEAEVIVIAIHASQKTRFSRLRARGRAGDPKNWSEFIERDLKELSWGLGNVIALADIVIINEGSLEEFKRSVEDFLKEVMNKWCT